MAAMVTVAFPPHLVAMETPRGFLSFTFGSSPLSIFFVLSESLAPNPSPSPSQDSLFSLSGSFSALTRHRRRRRSPSTSLAFAHIPSVFLRIRRKRSKEEPRDREEKRESLCASMRDNIRVVFPATDRNLLLGRLTESFDYLSTESDLRPLIGAHLGGRVI